MTWLSFLEFGSWHSWQRLGVHPFLSLAIPKLRLWTRLTYPLTTENDFGVVVYSNGCLLSYSHGTTLRRTSFGTYPMPLTPTPKSAFKNFPAHSTSHSCTNPLVRMKQFFLLWMMLYASHPKSHTYFGYSILSCALAPLP